MKKSILHTCLKIAKDHVHKHVYTGRKLHYSFLIADNSIVGWATNTHFVPPKHFGYSARINNNKAYCHSEISVWKKVKGLIVGQKFEIVNIRINKSGEIRMSKPCICCSSILTQLGCIKFYYSTENGFLSC